MNSLFERIVATLARLTVVAAVIALLSGCASLVERVEENSVLLKYVIERGTLDYIDTGQGVVDQERVAKLYDRVVNIRRYVNDSQSVSVQLLEAYISSQVPWQTMSLAEAQDARLLIATLEALLKRELDKRGEDTSVVVGQFLDIVAGTLDRYR